MVVNRQLADMGGEISKAPVLDGASDQVGVVAQGVPEGRLDAVLDRRLERHQRRQVVEKVTVGRLRLVVLGEERGQERRHLVILGQADLVELGPCAALVGGGLEELDAVHGDVREGHVLLGVGAVVIRVGVELAGGDVLLVLDLDRSSQNLECFRVLARKLGEQLADLDGRVEALLDRGDDVVVPDVVGLLLAHLVRRALRHPLVEVVLLVRAASLAVYLADGQ